MELGGRVKELQELLGWQEEGGTRQPGWGKIDKLWRDIRDGTKPWGQHQAEWHLTNLLGRLRREQKAVERRGLEQATHARLEAYMLQMGWTMGGTDEVEPELTKTAMKGAGPGGNG